MASIFGTERRESNEILCQFDQIRSRSIRKLIKFFSKFKSPAVGLRDQVVDVIVTWTQKHATELDKDRCYTVIKRMPFWEVKTFQNALFKTRTLKTFQNGRVMTSGIGYQDGRF